MSIATFDVEFTKEGRVFSTAQVDALIAGLAGVTDLLVLSHGWNNDMKDARDLYTDLLGNFEKVRKIAGPDKRTFAACLVFWPSKKFTDEELIPGGGAVSATVANDTSLDRVLDALARDPERLPVDAAAASKAETPAAQKALVDKAKTLAKDLSTPGNAEQFVWHLRALLDPSQASDDDASLDFFTRDPALLFAEMEKPVTAPRATGGGGAAAIAGTDGSAAGLKDLLSGAVSAARRLSNYATYYQMKARAGQVGKAGLAPVLQRVRTTSAVKIHFVGHSFGGRVVTAAAASLDPNTPNVTISLLQAAFSHNGLAKDYEPGKDGFFRSLLVEHRASGPIIITHTKNDSAVGIAYPLASRIANQKAAAFGDQNDPYGGMGRNGAQHTPEVNASATELQPVGGDYDFTTGSIYNLNADTFIKSHGDVTGPQVAAAILAVAKTI